METKSLPLPPTFRFEPRSESGGSNIWSYKSTIPEEILKTDRPRLCFLDSQANGFDGFDLHCHIILVWRFIICWLVD